MRNLFLFAAIAVLSTSPAAAAVTSPLDATQKAWCEANGPAMSAALSRNYDADWAAADDLDARSPGNAEVEKLHTLAINEMGAAAKIDDFYPGDKPGEDAVKAFLALDHLALIKKADTCLPPNLQY